ncbi:MAG: multicopper oxidase family protein [Terriglobales bacterium]
MRLTRRQFLERLAGGAGLAALALPAWAQTLRRGRGTLDPRRLTRFQHPLPLPPRAQPLPGESTFRVQMREALCQLHPELPPTRCWTYAGSVPGPTLEARSGQAISVIWENALPARHFLPVDHSLPGAAASLPPVRAVVHVHGARVPPGSDGYPEDWSVPGQSQQFYYPNCQEAAPLFYHDHAMGLSRLNVYAGLFGLYLIRDGREEELGLPREEFELPLMLCDRWLDRNGQLDYPTSGLPGHPWVPEVFGNAILVNGSLWPEASVEPRSYRLRLVNAANSRFFRCSLPPLPLQVIGSDQGLLAAPVRLRELSLAPGERADVIVDFSAAAGSALELRNDGLGILRFRVRPRVQAMPPAWTPPPRLRSLPRGRASDAQRVRRLTLREYDTLSGLPQQMLLDDRHWRDPVSEKPVLGAVEVWEFVNLSEDIHPIHLHMVRFQVLERQPFDADQYWAGGGMRYTGAAEPPAPEEMGWKDTVRCYAGAVTRILVRFTDFTGRYVWHCHILEHQANAMMRPYEILPAPAVERPGQSPQ